ncbi:sugar phosphate isomerase/epimerase family protein [Ruicaihuangia caeni]|uniref:Sugar phosphate isomerase/epimerase n=1 Tax=Ruicaihuangia caeni TaxID=3042517 RepID=A0AAW6T4S7_9MICO|nr:sugar phosphate isomerase/epimerase [Klugiella sp. YN-L-19]MDI2097354.1 sugar phosphate isomerase/epimerase [Klugiella sp. YN-L-19]
MISLGMSTSCVYPRGPEHAFQLARQAGYDGLEVMVTNDPVTQDADALNALAERFGMPILSIHAPVLLLTTFVWGRDPQVKLEKSAELAAKVGADTVVVHPPFRWQAGYARNFERIVRETAAASGVEIAVENMFPWKVRGSSVKAYAPSPDPTDMDCDAMTLDFSHAALSGAGSLELARRMGDRLRHIHLCDGSGSMDEGRVFDEHLVPGAGHEPVAEVLKMLIDSGWNGSIVAEVNTRKARTESEQLDLLIATRLFASRIIGRRRPSIRARARRAVASLRR